MTIFPTLLGARHGAEAEAAAIRAGEEDHAPAVVAAEAKAAEVEGAAATAAEVVAAAAAATHEKTIEHGSRLVSAIGQQRRRS